MIKIVANVKIGRKKLFINRNFCLLFWALSITDRTVFIISRHLVSIRFNCLGAALGTVLLASSLPAVVLAPFMCVKRIWDRKTIVVLTDIIRGLILQVLWGLLSR